MLDDAIRFCMDDDSEAGCFSMIIRLAGVSAGASCSVGVDFTPVSGKTFEWDWGDGTVETGLTAKPANAHVYASAGDYRIRVSGPVASIARTVDAPLLTMDGDANGCVTAVYVNDNAANGGSLVSFGYNLTGSYRDYNPVGLFSKAEGDPMEVTLTGAAALREIGSGVFAHGIFSRVELPHFVTTMGVKNFVDAVGPESIIFPDSVTYFGETQFGAHLSPETKEVAFPADLETVNGAFFGVYDGIANVTKLRIGTTREGAHYTDLGGNCIIRKDTMQLIFGYSRSTVPVGTRSIRYDIFRNIDERYDNKVPNGITIPNTVTSIGDDCFRTYYWEQRNITGVVTFESGITSIPRRFGAELLFFDPNSSAPKVIIPETVTSIGADAFSRTENSGYPSTSSFGITVKCMATNPPTLGSNAFYRKDAKNYSKLLVPPGCAYKYRNSEWGNKFGTITEY